MRNEYNNFEKYASRQSIARFLARYELFKKIKYIKGSIIECGVYEGNGIMAWGKLSSDFEPYAIDRKVIGFDTFEGFVKIDDKDRGIYDNTELKEKGFSTGHDIYTELQQLINEYDGNRFLNQFSKIELVKGDAIQTIPQYIQNNPHLVISLLFLDFD